ncbi:MAG: hypothetical protein PHE26_07915 [Syntrophomonadaceae bacterium]|nr:hypothetical protein [Syntrophomonadaceae bacterium]
MMIILQIDLRLKGTVAEIGDHGNRKLVDQFYRFTLHYGFKAQFCNPGKGHEKGNGKYMIM